MDIFGAPETFLTQLFDQAVGAADPLKALENALPTKPKGKTIIIGCGKGAAQMARALEKLWDAPLEGTVVTRYGYGETCERITVLEASHPVPDMNGIAASQHLMGLVDGLSEDDLVIALVCGGGSSLLPAPPSGFTLEDEQALNEVLLRSGANISTMNAIRKAFSQIKGGRLAARAWPAKVVSLIVSDVPGDVPSQVASGPTVPDAVSAADARRLIELHNIELPDHLRAHFDAEAGVAPDPGDEKFAHNEVKIIASAAISLAAAAAYVKSCGIEPVILSDCIEGEAREVAGVLGALATQTSDKQHPWRTPVVLLSGGETTVTIKGEGGKGGRNTEFALAFAKQIEGCYNISALFADTDGIDGSEQNAGAFVSGATMHQFYDAGIDPARMLIKNDSWTAFSKINGLFSPGPTGTNVNDFRAILIGDKT